MSAPPTIPDHTLLRPIGRGSYGEVWLARNVMGALRAVKVVERQQFDSDRPYLREFEGIQRYEPVSRSADGLVHVLHVGRRDTQGYFYYVMELADADEGMDLNGGIMTSEAADDAQLATVDAQTSRSPVNNYSPRTLRSTLKRLGRLPVSQCLRVALDVVGGLSRLHDRGLVHRDVKPGNIIFVEGRAKLADIGLVSTKMEGRTFVGTEGYIPPEGPGSPAADLYAFGMVLYEAVTGYLPEQFPKVPPEWFAEEAGTEWLEFHEVVLKACEGAKERRYQSAEEMQADLTLLHSGQSIRRLRALEKRVRHWRRVGAGAAIGVALALVTALVANWRARLAAENRAKETQLKQQAQQSLARAENAERESRQQLYTALLEQARATVRSGELGQRVGALDAIGRAATITNSIELRREAMAALALPDLRFESELTIGPDCTVTQVDPSFARIALVRGRGPAEIRDTTDNHLLAALPASTNLIANSALWSRDGRFLAIKRDYDPSGACGDLEVWHVAAGQQVLLIRAAAWSAWSFHPRLAQLVAGAANGWIKCWDLQNGQELAAVKVDGPPERLVHSPDGRRVAASHLRGDGWAVSIHRADDAGELASHSFAKRVYALDWHPNGRWLAASDGSGAVYEMDAQTGELRVLAQHKAEAVLTVFSPDGAYLMSGGWERELICWDVRGRRRALTIGLDSFVLSFRDDSRQCAIVTPSGVQFYAFEPPAVEREFSEDLGQRLRHVSFSPGGRCLAASGDQRLGVWDLAGPQPEPAALAEEGSEAQTFWSADGRELFGSRNNDSVTECFRWRITPGTNSGLPPGLERLSLPKPAGFTSLSVRSNDVVLTARRRSQLLARTDIGTNAAHWVRTSDGINGASPDGRWLAMYRPYDRWLYIYRLPDLQPVAKLTHPVSIGEFHFSPLGEELAVTSRWGVEFWSTQTWERTRVLTNFSRLFYTPDAGTWWLAKDLRTAGLYDARTLEPLLLLPPGMLPLALSQDGHQLAVSVDGRRLQVWDLPALRAELAKAGLDWSVETRSPPTGP
ncbi:MAG TPA: protein kinase [Verrucomicrobiae bacterium]|nr:protein kinase [Verrucomicrobiae bacterium]